MKNKQKELRELKENLEDAIDNLSHWESEVDDIKNNIMRLEEEMEKEDEIKEEDVIMERVDIFLDSAGAGDVFYDDILRALVFTSLESDNNLKLHNVFIGENAIFAMDGSRIITIRNDNIPVECRSKLLSNKYLPSQDINKFITRDDFTLGRVRNIINENKVNSGFSSDKYYSKTCNINNLLEETNHRTVDRKDSKLSVLEYKEGKVALNQSFFVASINMFNEGDTVDVLIPKSSRLNPICIKSKDIEIIICPIRVSELEIM